MRKAFKITLGVVIAAVLLFIVAIVIVANTINPNDYKAQITQEVKKATGRELTIDGNIEWAFFPWIGLTVDSVTLGNPANFKSRDKPLVHVKRAQVSIELLPLIIGHFNIGTLTLDAPVIHLITLRQGQHNWDFTTPDSDKPAKKSTRSTQAIAETNTVEPSTSSEKSDSMPVSISHIQVRDATVVWDNRQTKQFITVDNFQLTSGQIGFGDEFPIKTSFDITSKKPEGTGHFRLNGDVMLAPEKEQYEFSSLVVSLSADSPLLQGGRLALSANTDLSLDLKKQLIDIDSLEVKLDNMLLDADLKGSFDLKNPDLKGTIHLTSLNLKKIMSLLRQDIQTPKKSALTDINFDTDFSIDSNAINVDDLKLKLDGHTVKLNLSANNKRKTASFDLKADDLNFDHYLPLNIKSSAKSSKHQRKKKPVKQAGSTSSMQSGQRTDGTEHILAILRPFDATGHIAIEKLQMANMVITDLTGKMKAEKGIITLDPVSANIYGGKYRSQLKVNIRQSTPSINIKEDIKDLELGGLLNDMTGSRMMTGQLNADFSGSTRGLDVNKLIRNLNGNMKFNINNGVLHGIDIAEQLKIVSQFLSKGFKSSKGSGGGKTVFNEISGTGKIKRGVMSNNDLVLRSKLFNVNGNGIVNFNNQGINYNLGIRQGSSQDPIFQTFSAIGSGEVPLKVTGTLSNPSVSPDWSKLQKQLINVHGKKLLEGTGKAIEDAGKSLKNLIHF